MEIWANFPSDKTTSCSSRRFVSGNSKDPPKICPLETVVVPYCRVPSNTKKMFAKSYLFFCMIVSCLRLTMLELLIIL